jgi:hypothetical protein
MKRLTFVPKSRARIKIETIDPVEAGELGLSPHLEIAWDSDCRCLERLRSRVLVGSQEIVVRHARPDSGIGKEMPLSRQRHERRDGRCAVGALDEPDVRTGREIPPLELNLINIG